MLDFVGISQLKNKNELKHLRVTLKKKEFTLKRQRFSN